MHTRRDVPTTANTVRRLFLLSVPLLVSACGAGLEEPAAEQDAAQQTQAARVCTTFSRGLGWTVEDTTIVSTSPDSNFGWTPLLGVEHVSVPPLVDTRQHTLLRFDLGTIPANSTLHSATLHLFAVAQPRTVAVRGATAPWTENTVTWNSFNGAYDAAATTQISGGVVLSARSVEVSPLVDAWIARRRPNHGFVLTTTREVLSVPTHFYGSELEYPFSQQPALEVCYTTP
ncbi:DNRLRE domain-containing protein [Myxococcus sp. K38C18041901]|uniref:DNRLRE domain-containing protein n=1 Tax=Myxococcus guangdongensis TaxID=2906760 RepID=UPI0020A802F5|nr:DNRLRE domain-containing protein [Myxococcus guangdongensis]MCP3064031.1 DNRLRE domain-containing protein [Myxococcus guangdongensis]